MATLAQSVGTVNFDQALMAAATRAKAKYPNERSRIDRGILIAGTGGVDLLPSGIARIASQSHPGEYYEVNGRCTCPDVPKAPEGRCKHRWAKALYKAALAEQKRYPGPDRYWATYYSPTKEEMPGTAAFDKTMQCWLFTPEDGRDPFYAAIQALALGGHIATAEDQWHADGDMAHKVGQPQYPYKATAIAALGPLPRRNGHTPAPSR